ncbi:hypothetical protein K469DRAFT_713246 [Zopfia rhizophila CBS 207.26]|uniref:Uncharacterized protein n=1 Tax=Zopfia rhizophila CBS 207.26 TaxID=1314779 RepID=A0A6A6DTU6_9PEZI|nr:hypothetical protein K469DRAFT_713246 [Zopfia rhizophila CBS 207.26]
MREIRLCSARPPQHDDVLQLWHRLLPRFLLPVIRRLEVASAVASRYPAKSKPSLSTNVTTHLVEPTSAGVENI